LQAVASKSEAQAPRVALPGSTSRLTVINKPFPSPEEPGPGPGENGERGKGGGFRGRPSSWVDASLAASRASLGAPVGGGWRGKEGGRTEVGAGGTEAREAGSQGRLFPLPGSGPASTDGDRLRQVDEGPLANYRSPQSKGDGPSSLPPYDPSSRAGQGKSGPPVERTLRGGAQWGEGGERVDQGGVGTSGLPERSERGREGGRGGGRGAGRDGRGEEGYGGGWGGDGRGRRREPFSPSFPSSPPSPPASHRGPPGPASLFPHDPFSHPGGRQPRASHPTQGPASQASESHGSGTSIFCLSFLPLALLQPIAHPLLSPRKLGPTPRVLPACCPPLHPDLPEKRSGRTRSRAPFLFGLSGRRPPGVGGEGPR
jgi:hypothetical protein